LTAVALNKLCDIEDWNNAEFELLAADIMARQRGSEHAPRHRKLWEFTQLINSLKKYDLLKPNVRLLSVAAGTERILYYLSNFAERVIATDIYGDSSFANCEAQADALIQASKFAPYGYRQEALRFGYMNALDLAFPDHLFDAAFSLSSIEHFGGIKAAKKALSEMARVVRPGGLVMIATDCSINKITSHEVFSHKEMEQLAEGLPLKLAEPINWNVSKDSRASIIDVRREDTSKLPHINLKSFACKFTSISLTYIKQTTNNDSKKNALGIQEFDDCIKAIFTISRTKRFVSKPPSRIKRIWRAAKYRCLEKIIREPD
jgi:ubiquinone/menaquinone biosynthesis C-methylase UbiE